MSRTQSTRRSGATLPAASTIPITTGATRPSLLTAAPTARQVKARPPVNPLQNRRLAEATSPQLRGSRAAAWITVWDKGATLRRVGLLEALLLLHHDSNSSALEDDLGSSAPLFFARLTTWWKLRYEAWVSETAQKAKREAAAAAVVVAALTCGSDKGKAAHNTTRTKASNNAVVAVPTSSSSTDSRSSMSELLAQLEAITIFVRGSRYLLQFAEGGGAAMLTDCLEATAGAPAALPVTSGSSLRVSAPLSELRTVEPATGCDVYMRERLAATLLLLHLANAGRVYREMVGDAKGVVHVLHTLLREVDVRVAVPLTELLAVLGQGNPRLTGQVQTGLVRVLARALPVARDVETRQGTAAVSFSSSASPFSHQSAPQQDGGQSGGNAVVVVAVSRAVRALQLQMEQHHYAQFQFDKAGRVSTARTDALAARIDYVPIVGLESAFSRGGGAGTSSFAEVSAAPASRAGAASVAALPLDPLLRPFTLSEYLDTLFRLALDDERTAFRVEGNELLTLAAKNIRLTQDILLRCLDVVDDDLYTIEEDGFYEDEGAGGAGQLTRAETEARAREKLLRQRRQLSCGRTAVLVLISRPMTQERRRLLLQLVAQRSGHLTLLKYLRLTQHGDTAAVVDVCRAMQVMVRAATELQRQQQQQQPATLRGYGAGRRTTESDPSTTAEAVLLRMTEGIQSALGDSVFQLLLFQELSEADCLAILRSARAAVVASG